MTTIITKNLMDEVAAAEYLGIPEKSLKSAVKRRLGPICVRPTPRISMFTRESLDAWRSSWEVIEPKDKEV